MRRRVTALPGFYDSLLRLDHSEATAQAGRFLLLRAVLQPQGAETLPGMGIRVIKTFSASGFPALRLFYWIDEENLLLLEIEPYDDLADD